MIEFGTIVLVPFPFTDLSSAKVRPALVVSGARKDDDIILCFITSRIDPKQPHQLIVPPSRRTGLKVQSAIRFDKIVTLEKRVILGELGRIESGELRRNRRRFLSAFGF